MGLLKWGAKKGAVGGTARWVAQAYIAFVSAGRDMDEFLGFLMEARYGSPFTPEASAIFEYAGDAPGLSSITRSILALEAGFDQNTPANQVMFMEVIGEELVKAGVPREML